MRALLLTCLLAAALLAGCRAQPAVPATPTSAPKAVGPASPTAPDSRVLPTAAASGAVLRFGLLPITDVLPMYVADRLGLFRDAGVNVQLIPVASAAERDQLVQAGQLDGVLTDLVNTVLFNADQSRIRVVRKARQAFPNAPQFRLLAAANSGINSVQDLKGVEIGISENSVIAYWTDRVLVREGLAKSDIKTIAVPNIVQRAQLLGQGQLKAGVLPDPLGSLAMLSGAKVIVDDTKYPELGQSVLAFRTPYLQSNPDAVRRFLQAYDRAVGELRTRPEQFRSLLIETGRVPEQLQATFPMPLFPDPSVTSEAELKDVSDWALEKGIIRAPVSYATAVDTSFGR